MPTRKRGAEDQTLNNAGREDVLGREAKPRPGLCLLPGFGGLPLEMHQATKHVPCSVEASSKMRHCLEQDLLGHPKRT